MKWQTPLMIVLLVTGMSAQAKLFRNAYVSFELPPNWNCKLESSEWVCENDFSSKTKEAIIILTAKEVGPSDTIQSYLLHLQQPQSLPGRNGVPTKSKVIHVKERMITNHMWVDGMHEGSEIGPYFTRYLGTIKDKIAILVSFSAHKDQWSKYSADFIRAIESMKIVATKDSLGRMGVDSSGSTAGAGGNINAGASAGGGDTALTLIDDTNVPPPSGSGTAGNLLFGVIILGALGAFFYLRSRKPDAKSKSSRPKKK